jgi:alcohol dehydrogenase
VSNATRVGLGRPRSALIRPSRGSPTLAQFTHAGSFAEQIAIGAADFNLVRLPDAVDFVTAAVLGCRFATAFHALTAQARLRPEEWLAVFGCGVGLSAVMIAVALGARVVAVDLSPAALARAADLGAEATVAGTDPVSAVRSITEGGAHSSVDALGSAATAACAVRSLRARGRHVQVGLMLGQDERAALPWNLVVAHEMQVLGSHGMAARDYPAMLAMIADGRLEPQRLLGEVIDLGQAGEALMAMDRPVPAQGRHRGRHHLSERLQPLAA